MAAQPLLHLTTSPRVLAYRLIERTLRADPVLSNVVGLWSTWEGDPIRDPLPLALVGDSSIKLQPAMGPVDFWAVDSTRGDLIVDVDLIVRGTCYDDLDNLWYAMEQAIWPRDVTRQRAFILKLQQATQGGKGLVIFQRPASFIADDVDGSPCLRASGSLRTDVHELINP